MQVSKIEIEIWAQNNTASKFSFEPKDTFRPLQHISTDMHVLAVGWPRREPVRPPLHIAWTCVTENVIVLLFQLILTMKM